MKFITGPRGRRLAYHRTEGKGPGVVFLGGLMSDMEGTKALHLEAWAKANGQSFLRFDYSGHGQSDESFTDGAIGDWADDALAVISELTEGPQILVGSSMGGWISCLLLRRIPERIAGFVGIAAAPDFTEDSMWAGFSDVERAELLEKGIVYLPSDYGDPYPITRRFIEEGRGQLVLREKLPVKIPVRLLQGTADADVEVSVAMALLENLEGADIRLTLVKNSDHRFSSETELGLITQAVEEILNG